MSGWIHHGKVAVRALMRRPAFTSIAVTTLALGIGANTAVFSVIYGSLLRPLPYADVDGVVYLSDGHENFGGAGVDQSIPNLMDLREESRLLAASAMFATASGNLIGGDQPERVLVLQTSSELLGVLGLPPRLGRDFNPGDDVGGSEKVALITDGLWRRSFGADPDIVGRTTMMDAEPLRIVGVTPPTFTFPSRPDLLVPIQHIGREFSRGSRNYNAVGRLAPGASVEALREELRAIFNGLVEEYPEANGDGWYTWADPIETYILGPNQRSLWLLGGAVLLVLLIACVNVANLLLVRAEIRQRELAVRFALGASRARLLPHFVSEGVILALLGGAIGVVAAGWAVDLLVALYGESLSRGSEIELSGTVLAFGLVIALVVGVIVGLVPLHHARPGRLHEVLRDGARGTSVRRSRLGQALVASQVALAIVIVSAAGLVARSMWKLQHVDLGLSEIDRTLTFQVTLPEAKYQDGEPVVAFYEAMVEDLESVAGVEAAGFVNRLPLLGGWNTRVTVWDDPERAEDFVSFRPVTPGYFDALGIRLVSGRWLDANEYAEGTQSVLINETLARRLFSSTDPVGQRITDWVEGGMPVVGVVTDVKGAGPDRPTPPAMYFPFAAFGGVQAASGVVRTSGDPWALVPYLRQAVERLDAQLPVYRIRTMRDVARSRVGTRRFAVSLFGIFAGLALLLGAVGIYGVMAYSVTQRAPELGVRMALGARQTAILRMVLAEGGRIVAIGVAIGVVMALASARLLESLLFDVSPLDGATYVSVVAILACVGLGATFVPALRATRVDPLTSIRSD